MNLQNVEPDRDAFDLVGACVGLMHPSELTLGDKVRPGHAIVGFASSGIHSNGLTLARRALLHDAGYSLEEAIPNLSGSLGDELLRPTEIYVNAVRALRSASIAVHGMVHITGDGFANLCRLDSEVTYEIDELPPVPPIFEVIKTAGAVDDGEMYRVFNMGIGFIVVVDDNDAEKTITAATSAGYKASRIGSVVEGPRQVTIGPAGLVGMLDAGESSFRAL